jgi:hypothetical protein
VTRPGFEGKTYDPLRDEQRLSSELWLVAAVLRDGRYWTVREIREEILRRWQTDCSETGVSARIRDLRKPHHGGHVVVSRVRSGTGSRHLARSGTWEYRLQPNGALFPTS